MMRWFLNLVFLVFLGVMPAMAAEENADADNSESVTAAHYVCERNVDVPAVYIETKDGNSYAVIQAEGKLVPMQRQISASGAIYYAIDEHDGYRWYSKGDEAWLAYSRPDKDAEEETLLSSCQAVDE